MKKMLMALLMLAFAVSPALAAVTFNGNDGGAGFNNTTFSFNNTGTGGPQNLVTVSLNLEKNLTIPSTTSVSYNGVTMTLLVQGVAGGSNYLRGEIWGLLAPATGAHNVVVVCTGVTGSNIAATAQSYDNVLSIGQGLDSTASTTNNTLSLTITSSTANSFYAQACAQDGGTFTRVNGQTNRITFGGQVPNLGTFDSVPGAGAGNIAVNDLSSPATNSYGKVFMALELIPPIPPTATITPTSTITQTFTNTATPTFTRTATRTVTPSITATPSITSTFTISPTFSRSPTSTFTVTVTRTATPTSTPATPSPTVTPRPVIYESLPRWVNTLPGGLGSIPTNPVFVMLVTPTNTPTPNLTQTYIATHSVTPTPSPSPTTGP